MYEDRFPNLAFSVSTVRGKKIIGRPLKHLIDEIHLKIETDHCVYIREGYGNDCIFENNIDFSLYHY